MQEEVEILKDKAANYKASEIFAGVPEDGAEEIETAVIDQSDFDEKIEIDGEEVEDASVVEEIRDNYEEAKETKAESVESEDVRQDELSEKANDIKKKFVSMINPKTVVTFANMFLSRGGGLAMKKSKKKDWDLDEDEKQFLADVLEVMIEEEGIEFWPAKVWLILALIFFYGMKSWDNYEMYYQGNQINGKDPEERKRLTQIEFDHAEADLFEMEKKAELAERHAKLQIRIDNANAFKNGSDHKTVKSNQETKTDLTKTEDGRVFPKELYPDNVYHYIDGELQLGLNGVPKKKPGKKKGDTSDVYIDPRTKRFVSKSNFEEMIKEGIINEAGELIEAETVETEDVEFIEISKT